MINLDTHMVVHLLADTLTPQETDVLRAEPGGISGMVLWELAMLTRLGRIELDFDDSAFKAELRKWTVWPIDVAVARASTRLDFRSDPADELIAATSMVHGVPLLTRDRKILASKMVPLALIP